MFDCVAVLWFEASTQLPLFWLTSPPFRNATFLPLTTTGADDPHWFVVFSARLDWLADWDTSPLPEPQQPEPVTVWVCPSPFHWLFDCVAVLWFEASTQLPLFWLTSPPAGAHELQASCTQPLPTATFGPLTTSGAE